MNRFDPRLTSYSFRPIQSFCPFIPFIVVFGYAVRLLKKKKKNKNKIKNKNKNKQKTKRKAVKLPLYQIFVQCQLQVWGYKCEQQPIFHQSVKH